jgi:uncharacterized protein YbaR (Trm112 family)
MLLIGTDKRLDLGTAMIPDDLLQLLRCPLDTSVPLEYQEESAAKLPALRCTRCSLLYPVRDEIPCMLPEEAILPPGCPDMDHLPCQKSPKPG